MSHQDPLDNVSQAELLFDQHELDRAEEIARRILHHDPMHPRALQVLEMIESRRDRPSEAIPLLERALAIQPDLPSILTGAVGAIRFRRDLCQCSRDLTHFKRAPKDEDHRDS